MTIKHFKMIHTRAERDRHCGTSKIPLQTLSSLVGLQTYFAVLQTGWELWTVISLSNQRPTSHLISLYPGKYYRLETAEINLSIMRVHEKHLPKPYATAKIFLSFKTRPFSRRRPKIFKKVNYYDFIPSF